MADTIGDLRASLGSHLDSVKTSLGVSETTVLTPAQKLTVSETVDSVNEVWNGDLPPRPSK